MAPNYPAVTTIGQMAKLIGFFFALCLLIRIIFSTLLSLSLYSFIVIVVIVVVTFSAFYTVGTTSTINSTSGVCNEYAIRGLLCLFVMCTGKRKEFSARNVRQFLVSVFLFNMHVCVCVCFGDALIITMQKPFNSG